MVSKFYKSGIICLSLLLFGSVSSIHAQARVAVVPAFFNPNITKLGDTDVVFECFDKARKKIANDSVGEFGSIWYVSKLKNYIDYTKKFKDTDGIEKPLPVSVIVYRYDRLNKISWMAVDYATNKMSTLTEERSNTTKVEKMKAKDGSEIEFRFFNCTTSQD